MNAAFPVGSKDVNPAYAVIIMVGIVWKGKKKM